jgi:hypothetical protein
MRPGFALRTRTLDIVNAAEKILRQIYNPHSIAKELETIASDQLVVVDARAPWLENARLRAV